MKIVKFSFRLVEFTQRYAENLEKKTNLEIIEISSREKLMDSPDLILLKMYGRYMICCLN